jgi:diguanylate cyclase (GGDEF)-like protein
LNTQQLSPRVVADLKKRSRPGILIYPLVLGLVLFSTGYAFREPEFSLQFVVIVGAVCLFRLVHSLVMSRIPEAYAELSLWVFLGEIGLTALVWGIGYAKFLGLPQEPELKLLMVVCTTGLCSGACSAYAPFFPLSLAYNALIMWPGIVYMLFLGGNSAMVVLFVMFSVYTGFMSFRGNAEYRTALDNEALLKQQAKDLERISNVDGLTGLYNRRYFDTAFELAWQNAVRQRTRLALVICDIDFFKKINDDYGHLAGDEYLRTIAHHLSRTFRRQNDIVARYGGEEFVVLLAGVKKGMALELAEGFRGTMAETCLRFESHTIRATVSLGVAETLPSSGQEKETLLARADAMLYKAKASGRNRVKSDSR